MDSSNSLIQANTPESNANIPTFEEFAKPWWHWDTCPYVLARRAAGTESHPGINKSYVTCNELWTRKYLIPGMRYELTEELACAIGFDLIYRGNYFILGAIGEPTIKGKIIDGVAKDVIVCYDISPNGLDKLPSEAAIAYAHRGISAAYFANCVEGMTVIEPEKRFV